MLRRNKTTATHSGSGSRSVHSGYAPDATQTPGKFSVHKMHWWADPQALRKVTEAGVFLVLILIVGIYGSALFYRTSEAARRKSCQDNLRMVTLALQMYSQDHDGRLPPAGGDLARQLFPYLPQIRFLLCPSDDLARTAGRHRQLQRVAISYTYRPPFARSIDTLPDSTRTPLLWDRTGGIPTGAHRQGGNVLFADGHSRWWPLQYWAAGDMPYWDGRRMPVASSRRER